MELVNQGSFSLDRILEKSNITKIDFDATGLKEAELEKIFLDYLSLQNTLLSLAQFVVNVALKFEKVHSVRYRLKDPDHLIAKIIRKTKDDPERKFTLEGYKEQIKDLVGLRILHLFKVDFHSIDEAIRKNFKLTEKPVINHRKGDNVEESELFDIKPHPRGYRSVHYIIESTPSNQTHYIEIQVRTIFEEGWSEVDHELLYPRNTNDILLNEFSMVLNTLSGGADAMSAVMKNLVTAFDDLKRDHELSLSIKDEKITLLQAKINRSNMKSEDKKIVADILNKRPQSYKNVSEMFKKQDKATGLFGAAYLAKHGDITRSLEAMTRIHNLGGGLGKALQDAINVGTMIKPFADSNTQSEENKEENDL